MAANPPHSYPGFDRIKSDHDFKELLDLVSQIRTGALISSQQKVNPATAPTSTSVAGDSSSQKANPDAAVPTSTPDAAPTSIIKETNYRRAVDMLETDIKYIKDNIDSLQNSTDAKRADILLQFLMDAKKKRTPADFKDEDNAVNLRKLLQIIAKLKLWVPPQRKEDESNQSKAASKKKEKSPFQTSKEKDNAATEILTELFGLRCKQWGLDGLLKSYGELTDTQKLCLLCFSAFHCQSEKLNEAKDGGISNNSKNDENEDDEVSKSLKIRKKILIHWWIGEGLIDLHSKPVDVPVPNSNPDPDQKKKKKTVEQIGEEILKVLKEKGFIYPVMKASQESSRVLMHPFVHSFVTALAKRAGFFDFSDKDGKQTPSFGLSQRACLVKFPDKQSSCKLWETYTDDRNKLKRFGNVQTLFNVNEPIIDIKPEWFSKMTELSILHLGSWRSDPVEHIEVEDTKFMEDFKTMVKMRLFSLQGVSTIMKLSDSVCKLENLVILDLRECHNLEELPVDIGCLKSLTHLDITNCHLLTKLPKGISLLSKLEVLKGFVIYDQAGDKEVRKRSFPRRWCRKARGCVVHDVLRFKNKVECTLKDLEKLQELRELSIVVNIDEFPTKDEVQVYRNMRNLSKLKISWEKSFKKPENANVNKAGKKCGWYFRKNPPATGAGTAEQSAVPEATDAGAEQESENPSETGAGTAEHSAVPEATDADAEQESSAGQSAVPEATNDDSCCLNLKYCNSSGKGNAEPEFKLLDQIEKLELWCFPKKTAPKWLNRDQLTNLKKLYIKGGVLAKVPGYKGSDEEKKEWKNITTLRLKYLPELEITWLEFKDMFPNLIYLEKSVCEKLRFFPCDQEGVWQK